MGWIVSMIIAFIVFAVLMLLGFIFRKYKKSEPDKRAGTRRGKDDFGESRNDRSSDMRSLGTLLLVIAPIILTIWVGAHTFATSFKQIPYGHVGIEITFRSITGQVGEGAQWIAPWKTLHVESVQVQSFSSEDIPQDIIKSTAGEGSSVPDGYLGTCSADTQDVYMKTTLNLRISRESIQKLYTNVGGRWREIIVAPRLANYVKEETVKYQSTEIAPNREAIRVAVKDRLTLELQTFSVEVTDFLIDNLDFNPEFKAAIEAKQIAKQQALEEEARVEKFRQMGLQAKVKAEGEAEAVKITADANAYANEVLAASLNNPTLISYMLAQKLGDDIKVILLPTGSNFILDLNSLGLTNNTAP